MKFRSLILAGVVALVGGALGGCCCNLFCKIPDCDPCKPTCNPCDPCAPPCAVPSSGPAPVAAPAPVYAPAPTAPAAGPGGAACGASGKACGK